MRHQKKKKYSDQQEIDRKDHSQKEYLRTQKYKTGWRARWGEFKDHLVKIFRICFLIMVPIDAFMMVSVKIVSTGYGSLKTTSLLFPITKEEEVVSTIGKLYKMENSLSKMPELRKLKVLKMEPSTLKFTPRKVCFQTFPQRTAITI